MKWIKHLVLFWILLMSNPVLSLTIDNTVELNRNKSYDFESIARYELSHKHPETDFEVIDRWQNHPDGWNLFIKEGLGIRLDSDQRKIVKAVQHNKRISVRSGNSRGKDYVAAALAICNVVLRYPSKTILTAPTGRQVTEIMMAEISKMYKNSKVSIGGELLTSKIKFENKEHYLLGFKAADKKMEAWSGFHSPNIMVIVTEASGLEKENFDAIEGILQGDSKLIIIFNPIRTTGEAFKSTRDPAYIKFRLNSLKSVNVRAKKILIPGQVDWDWINDRIGKPGWSILISEEEFDLTMYDFKWEGKCYRPSPLFMVKVLGEFPRESDDVLVPYIWIEQANNRWLEWQASVKLETHPTFVGVDVAGMGSDQTVCVYRMHNIIKKIEVFNFKKDATIHMKIATKVMEILKDIQGGAIDAIGEGAGVYSAMIQNECSNIINGKGSYSAEGLTDLSGERKFLNMRAFLYWSIRDALDPAYGFDLMLPPDDELMQELSEIHYETNILTGKIKIEKKDDIKKNIGRSPDKADALSFSFYPPDMNSDGLIEVGEYQA